MLLNVHIKNIALIEDANINFTDGLNILTGETVQVSLLSWEL